MSTQAITTTIICTGQRAVYKIAIQCNNFLEESYFVSTKMKGDTGVKGNIISNPNSKNCKTGFNDLQKSINVLPVQGDVKDKELQFLKIATQKIINHFCKTEVHSTTTENAIIVTSEDPTTLKPTTANFVTTITTVMQKVANATMNTITTTVVELLDPTNSTISGNDISSIVQNDITNSTIADSTTIYSFDSNNSTEYPTQDNGGSEAGKIIVIAALSALAVFATAGTAVAAYIYIPSVKEKVNGWINAMNICNRTTYEKVNDPEMATFENRSDEINILGNKDEEEIV